MAKKRGRGRTGRRFKGTERHFRLQIFATAAAVATLGKQLGEKRIAPYLGNNAAAGLRITESSSAQWIQSPVESSWGYVAQFSASWFVERVSSEKSSAGAPIRNRPLSKKKTGLTGGISFTPDGLTAVLRPEQPR